MAHLWSRVIRCYMSQYGSSLEQSNTVLLEVPKLLTAEGLTLHTQEYRYLGEG